jgi:exopolysaccharide biosynthesis polyprenyl glycosylphosphotransferase
MFFEHTLPRMRVNRKLYWGATALVSDTMIVLSSVMLALGLVNHRSAESMFLSSNAVLILVAPLTFVSFLTSRGVYRRIASLSWKFQSLNALKAYTYCLISLSSLVVFFPELNIPTSSIVFFLAVFPILYAVVWMGLRRWMNRMRRGGNQRLKTLLVHSGVDGGTEAARLHDLLGIGYDVVEVIEGKKFHTAARGHVLDSSAIKSVIDTKSIEHIVVASSDFTDWYRDLEELCRDHQVRMSVISPDVDTLLTSTVIGDDTCLSLSFHEPRTVRPMRQRLKRSVDFVISVALLVLFSPLFLLIALATKLESRGPVLFKQRRSLSDIDQSFDLYKFRSMRISADTEKDTLRQLNESDGALFKIRNDPRLTRVGKILRRFSLDELPQLINVVKGDMSLVGPRPLPISDFSFVKYEGESAAYLRYRAKGKPGMTGLWQISGRSNLGFREMLLLDFYYIDNQSLLFDLEILLQTIPAVFLGKGAY